MRAFVVSHSRVVSHCVTLDMTLESCHTVSQTRHPPHDTSHLSTLHDTSHYESEAVKRPRTRSAAAQHPRMRSCHELERLV